jgi:hypothetical protein
LGLARSAVAGAIDILSREAEASKTIVVETAVGKTVVDKTDADVAVSS